MASQNPVTFTQLQWACDSLCNMSLYLQFIPQSLFIKQKIAVAATKSGLVISALHWASLELLIAHICDVFSLKSMGLPCFQVTSEQRELNRFSSRSEIGRKKIHLLCDCLSCDCPWLSKRNRRKLYWVFFFVLKQSKMLLDKSDIVG